MMRRFTAGKPLRLLAAALLAPLGAGLFGLVAIVAFLLWRVAGSMEDAIANHGAAPIWVAVLVGVFGVPVIIATLLGHAVLALLGLRRLWAYAAAGLGTGVLLAFKLAEGATSCPPTMHGACPEPPSGDELTAMLGFDIASGLAPALGAAVTFWLVLRPDRPRSS